MSVPKIAALSARAVLVPFRHPPVAAAGAIDTAPLVLLDLATSAGITGRSYLMSYSVAMQRATLAAVEALGELVADEPLDPLTLDQRAKHYAVALQ